MDVCLYILYSSETYASQQEPGPKMVVSLGGLHILDLSRRRTKVAWFRVRVC